MVCSRLPSGLLAASARLTPEGLSSEHEGTAVQAVVDLGSSLTLCTWAAAEAIGLRRQGDPRARLTDDVIAGATGEPVRVWEARLTVELGGVRREDMLVNIADLPIFGAIGLPAAAAVIGLDTLAPRADGGAEEQGSRVVLAARDGRVWLE